MDKAFEKYFNENPQEEMIFKEVCQRANLTEKEFEVFLASVARIVKHSVRIGIREFLNNL